MENTRTYDELKADWQNTRRKIIELEGKGKTANKEYEDLICNLREIESQVKALVEGPKKAEVKTPEQLRSEYRRISVQMKFLSSTGKSNSSDYRSLYLELQQVSELIKQTS